MLLLKIKLPISASLMFKIMSDPLNWNIINFPIISEIDILEKSSNKVDFYIIESLFGKKYKSHIILTINDRHKLIEYNHKDQLLHL